MLIVNCRYLRMCVIVETITVTLSLSGISCMMAFTAQSTLHAARPTKGMSMDADYLFKQTALNPISLSGIEPGFEAI